MKVKKKRTSKGFERRRTDIRPPIGPLDNHDEPFVIDNFPLEIDVGEKHATTPGLLVPPSEEKPHWTRKKSHLDRLLVLRKNKGGKRFDFELYELKKRQLIQIRLDGGTSLDLSLVMAEKPDDSLLAITPHDFKLKKDEARKRRLINDGGKKARIAEIEIHSGTSAPPKRIVVEEGSVYLVFYLGAHTH
jgi:hypothetical protein